MEKTFQGWSPEILIENTIRNIQRTPPGDKNFKKYIPFDSLNVLSAAHAMRAARVVPVRADSFSKPERNPKKIPHQQGITKKFHTNKAAQAQDSRRESDTESKHEGVEEAEVKIKGHLERTCENKEAIAHTPAYV